MAVREKKHRLPDEFYRGQLSVAFTLCLQGTSQEFLDSEANRFLREVLASASAEQLCLVPVYCFMPDHQHFILTGTADNSDLLKVVKLYKQKTGYWLSKNNLGVWWQKDFFDHVIRRDENLSVQVKYILDNPVRKGLAKVWDEYPFKGAIGCSLDEILRSLV